MHLRDSKRSPFPQNITAQCICYSIIVSPQKEILVFSSQYVNREEIILYKYNEFLKKKICTCSAI